MVGGIRNGNLQQKGHDEDRDANPLNDRLPGEVVRRRPKPEPKGDAPVPGMKEVAVTDLESVLAKGSGTREKWLKKALQQMEDDLVSVDDIYDIVTHPGFAKDLKEQTGRSMFRLLKSKISLFPRSFRHEISHGCSLARQYGRDPDTSSGPLKSRMASDPPKFDAKADRAAEDEMTNSRARSRSRESRSAVATTSDVFSAPESVLAKRPPDKEGLSSALVASIGERHPVSVLVRAPVGPPAASREDGRITEGAAKSHAEQRSPWDPAPARSDKSAISAILAAAAASAPVPVQQHSQSQVGDKSRDVTPSESASKPSSEMRSQWDPAPAKPDISAVAAIVASAAAGSRNAILRDKNKEKESAKKKLVGVFETDAEPEPSASSTVCTPTAQNPDTLRQFVAAAALGVRNPVAMRSTSFVPEPTIQVKRTTNSRVDRFIGTGRARSRSRSEKYSRGRSRSRDKPTRARSKSWDRSRASWDREPAPARSDRYARERSRSWDGGRRRDRVRT